MPDSIAFVDQPGEVEIRPDGVRITYRSGSSTYERHCSRSVFRHYLETSLRKLNAYEASERDNVIEGRFTQHG